MKKILIITFLLLVIGCAVVFAQPPPPPPPPDPGGNDIYIGGAPIADGIVVLIALSLAYATRKIYNRRKRKIAE